MHDHGFRWTRNPWHARFLLTLKRYRLRRAARLWGCFLGIDAPGELPQSLALPHPYSIVVSAKTTLGEGCVLYHGVTIGNDDDGGAPTLADGVEVYPGACIIGAITIGTGSRIGANSVVTRDVPANTTAVGAPARIVARTAVP